MRGFVPRGSNFGLAAAVTNYNRKPELTCAFARRMFAAVVEHYFDDFAILEPRFSIATGVFVFLVELAQLVHIYLDDIGLCPCT